MIVVGIPVYHSLKTLGRTLDSLVCQTRKSFLTVICQDGDGEDYSSIIKEYERRGLSISLITKKENRGPGLARQEILNRAISKNIQYIMFCDSDDILQPRAVEILYDEAIKRNADIVCGDIIRTEKNGLDSYIASDGGSVTWLGGKIYKVDYLKKISLSFPKELFWNEDAYFNLVAFECSKKVYAIKEPLYLWQHNPNSITRKQNKKETVKKGNAQYIHSQAKALLKILFINKNIKEDTLFKALENIYYALMEQLFYNIDDWSWCPQVEDLRDNDYIQKLMTKENIEKYSKNIYTKNTYEKQRYVFPFSFEDFLKSFVIRRASDGIYY